MRSNFGRDLIDHAACGPLKARRLVDAGKDLGIPGSALVSPISRFGGEMDNGIVGDLRQSILQSQNRLLDQF